MEPDATPYKYSFEDQSILHRVMRGFVLIPIVHAIPPRVHPNTVTVLGHVIAWSGLAVVVASVLSPAPTTSAGVLLWIAFAAIVYHLCDWVDGSYARHTNQASALGEVLDHWLDGFSTPAIPFSVALAMQLPPWLTLLGTGAVGFTLFITLLHTYRVGHTVFGPIGMCEGTFGSAALCCIAAVVGVGPLIRPVLGSASIAGILLSAPVAGGIGVLIAMRKVYAWSHDIVLPAILFAAVGVWYVFGHLGVLPAGFLILGTTTQTCGRIMAARSLQRPLRLWDFAFLCFSALLIGGAVVSIALGLDERGQTLLAAVTVVYALVVSAIGLARTKAALARA